jgi:hypothetical protein
MPIPNAPTNFSVGVAPAPAAAIGANTLCYGTALKTTGTSANLYDYNMLGVTAVPGSSTNPDGSILVTGVAGDKYGASLCSARKVGSVGQGFAFGGDSYIEVTAKFVPTLDPTGGGHLPFPAIWAVNILRLLQVGGVNRWSEVDIMQWTRNSLSYVSMACLIDWTLTSSVIQPSDGEVFLSGFDFGAYHRYGVRWEKAPPAKPGILRSYIDRQEVHYARGFPPITWPYGDPAGTVLDGSHLALIVGTHPSCEMTLKEACVWSKSAAGNWVQ